MPPNSRLQPTGSAGRLNRGSVGRISREIFVALEVTNLGNLWSPSYLT